MGADNIGWWPGCYVKPKHMYTISALYLLECLMYGAITRCWEAVEYLSFNTVSALLTRHLAYVVAMLLES